MHRFGRCVITPLLEGSIRTTNTQLPSLREQAVTSLECASKCKAVCETLQEFEEINTFQEHTKNYAYSSEYLHDYKEMKDLFASMHRDDYEKYRNDMIGYFLIGVPLEEKQNLTASNERLLKLMEDGTGDHNAISAEERENALIQQRCCCAMERDGETTLVRIHASMTSIQANWRGYICRKNL